MILGNKDDIDTLAKEINEKIKKNYEGATISRENFGLFKAWNSRLDVRVRRVELQRHDNEKELQSSEFWKFSSFELSGKLQDFNEKIALDCQEELGVFSKDFLEFYEKNTQCFENDTIISRVNLENILENMRNEKAIFTLNITRQLTKVFQRFISIILILICEFIVI